MTVPRLEIDLAKIRHNARTLVGQLESRGISITGITKAVLGTPEIAWILISAGIRAIGDSRIENIEAMCVAPILAPMALIRTPMMSQVDRVVAHADISFNTELDVISKLSSAARKLGRTHGIILMVELGDLREGIMPGDLENVVRDTLMFPNIQFKGIGTNLGCCHGVSPDARNMAELSALADSIDATFGPIIDTVSGGNSSALQWAFSETDTGRVNNLRLGEALLLGRNPLNREPIEGLYCDAFMLFAEVIESKIKPSQPWGKIAQSAFGQNVPLPDQGNISQAILAIGHQDTDPAGLFPPAGIAILGASSDHVVIDAGRHRLPLGTEIAFQINYSALVRAMSSPFVGKFLMPPASKNNRSRSTVDERDYG
jgi:predicted amino acid racemase